MHRLNHVISTILFTFVLANAVPAKALGNANIDTSTGSGHLDRSLFYKFPIKPFAKVGNSSGAPCRFTTSEVGLLLDSPAGKQLSLRTQYCWRGPQGSGDYVNFLNLETGEVIGQNLRIAAPELGGDYFEYRKSLEDFAKELRSSGAPDDAVAYIDQVLIYLASCGKINGLHRFMTPDELTWNSRNEFQVEYLVAQDSDLLVDVTDEQGTAVVRQRYRLETGPDRKLSVAVSLPARKSPGRLTIHKAIVPIGADLSQTVVDEWTSAAGRFVSTDSYLDIWWVKLFTPGTRETYIDFNNTNIVRASDLIIRVSDQSGRVVIDSRQPVGPTDPKYAGKSGLSVKLKVPDELPKGEVYQLEARLVSTGKVWDDYLFRIAKGDVALVDWPH